MYNLIELIGLVIDGFVVSVDYESDLNDVVVEERLVSFFFCLN
jgi:hypothetical protein